MPGSSTRGALDAPTASASPHADRDLDLDLDLDLPWYARTRGTAWMLLVTSLIAMAATVVIIIERSILAADPTHRTSCDLNPWVSCGQVMQSWQAQTFGFPNTFIGVVAFSVLITVAMSLFAGARFARWYWLLMNACILAGFAFCVWLWHSAVYDIGTLCLYCMVVWTMVTVQLGLITSRTIQTGALGSGSPRAAALARDLTWPFVVLVLLGVAVSILLEMGLGVLGIG
ncbi:vitamin K epoxide reductase family protein [Micrococcus sp. NPDC078436]|uniref:vitamin K epoxide reductase family protein n=1 Tax=Micrococcus sp. NPDC078436 TaxID=3154960 RepID=UPI00344D9360